MKTSLWMRAKMKTSEDLSGKVVNAILSGRKLGFF